MRLYKRIASNIRFLLTFYVTTCYGLRNHDLGIVASGLELVSPDVAGLRFYADVNNTGDKAYTVELLADRCCLHSAPAEDCGILDHLVGCYDVIPEGKVKRLTLVVPLLDALERKGYCLAYIDSKLSDDSHNTMRNSVKIHFDTTLSNRKQLSDVPRNAVPCKLDEDPLEHCNPVDCDTFYNGKRPYYDVRKKRCVEAPTCVSETTDDMPSPYYNPNRNVCIEKEPIAKEDIDFIKKMVHAGRERSEKDMLIINNYRKNKMQSVTTIKLADKNMVVSTEATSESGNATKNAPRLGDDMTLIKGRYNNLNLKDKYNMFMNVNWKDVVTRLTMNRLTLCVLAAVIIVQCMLICTMIYFLAKNCCPIGNKKVNCKYFNYRQDASMTTPLINTSNVDTETTDYQFQSETSNVENKIKCYKACQKGHDMTKSCLSDDILAKCFNRRDWRVSLNSDAKSEAINEVTRQLFDVEKYVDVERDRRASDIIYKKASDVKVNFETEVTKTSAEDRSSKYKSAKRTDSKSSNLRKSDDFNDSVTVSSERELQCHSYKYTGSSNFTNAFGHSQNTYDGSRKSQPTQKLAFVTEMERPRNKSLKSESTEKSAQACFSNDSIDDFLSERGMLYLAGDEISKYAFSVTSNGTHSSSESSSKSSKRNIIKNVLSLLNRSTKHGPLSDPGVEKSKESLDLELIHMSKASVISSSNNDSTCMRTFKKLRDSRTSL